MVSGITMATTTLTSKDGSTLINFLALHNQYGLSMNADNIQAASYFQNFQAT